MEDLLPVVMDLKGQVAALDAQVKILLWFVGATMVPVWLGTFTALWKASHIVKFLKGGVSNEGGN